MSSGHGLTSRISDIKKETADFFRFVNPYLMLNSCSPLVRNKFSRTAGPHVVVDLSSFFETARHPAARLDGQRKIATSPPNSGSVWHPPFLRDIRWDFVTTAAIASLCQTPTESLWLVVADRLMTPPRFDSLIVSEFPPCSKSSVGGVSISCGGAVQGKPLEHFNRFTSDEAAQSIAIRLRNRP
jgi:hypothetical protein